MSSATTSSTTLRSGDASCIGDRSLQIAADADWLQTATQAKIRGEEWAERSGFVPAPSWLPFASSLRGTAGRRHSLAPRPAGRRGGRRHDGPAEKRLRRARPRSRGPRLEPPTAEMAPRGHRPSSTTARGLRGAQNGIRPRCGTMRGVCAEIAEIEARPRRQQAAQRPGIARIERGLRKDLILTRPVGDATRHCCRYPACHYCGKVAVCRSRRTQRSAAQRSAEQRRAAQSSGQVCNCLQDAGCRRWTCLVPLLWRGKATGSRKIPHPPFLGLPCSAAAVERRYYTRRRESRTRRKEETRSEGSSQESGDWSARHAQSYSPVLFAVPGLSPVSRPRGLEISMSGSLDGGLACMVEARQGAAPR